MFRGSLRVLLKTGATSCTCYKRGGVDGSSVCHGRPTSHTRIVDTQTAKNCNVSVQLLIWTSTFPRSTRQNLHSAQWTPAKLHGVYSQRDLFLDHCRWFKLLPWMILCHCARVSTFIASPSDFGQTVFWVKLYCMKAFKTEGGCRSTPVLKPLRIPATFHCSTHLAKLLTLTHLCENPLFILS